MPQKQRLLFVSHEMTLSGAPIQLAYLVQWLRARGWETTVVAPELGPVAAKLADVEILYEPKLLIDPVYGALRRLASEFDLVIANTIAAWEAVQAAHLERVPVIWYVHETQVAMHLMKAIHMIEPSLALADKIVAPTETTARIYAPFVSKRIEILPYGIPEVVDCAPRELSGVLTFVVLGTYEPRKGQDVLLQGLQLLSAEMHARAFFRLAGRELDEAFCASLRREAAGLPNVELLGAVEHEKAMRLLINSDVLICPSRDETMPIVLLEAMSLGNPIICTEVGGILEWLRDGENALLVRSEDANGLANAIQRIITDDALRTQLGRAARMTFERHFTLDPYGERFAEVITQTMQDAAVFPR